MRFLVLIGLLLPFGCGDDDGGLIDGGPPDSGSATSDGSVDSEVPEDAGMDAGRDSGTEARDAGQDSGALDAGQDAGRDASASDGGSVVDAGSGVVDVTAAMMDPRQAFARGIVADGRFVVAGGYGGRDTPTETWGFDLATATWTQTTDIPAPHIGATSTVLDDGRLMISGGAPAQFARESNQDIYIFDSTDDSWSSAGMMNARRDGHAAMILRRGPDAGKVVIISGQRRGMTSTIYLADFELYDLDTQISTPLMDTNLPIARAGQFYHELDDGRILIGGGYIVPGNPSGSAIDEIVIYDPMDHSVTVQTETLPVAQLYRYQGLLPDGRLLLLPAFSATDFMTYALDPETLVFTPLALFPQTRTFYGFGYLPSGTAYVFGGRADGDLTDAIEQYDPIAGTFTPLGDVLPQPLSLVIPVALPDERILLFGGQTDRGFIVGHTLLFAP